MFRIKSCFTVFMLILVTGLYAQDFDYPRPSPSSSVMQVVGLTEVTIEYSSPGVKGRKIWDGLVPYDKVWRTGANAATKITFSTDVKIDGKELKAGSYSLFTVPGNESWKIMFNSRTNIGGTDYKAEADVLTTSARPSAGPMMERMTFLITDNDNKSANIVMAWEKLRIAFKMETNTAEMVVKGAEAEVGRSWRASFDAASYFLSQDMELEKAHEYAVLSTSINEMYWNMRTRAQIEAKLGKKKEAMKTMKAALAHGEKMENKPFDFDRMTAMLDEWKGE